MRFANIIAVLAVSTTVGCATETDITRTVTMPDGKSETYINKSKGYNYNPNYTGTNEQSVHVRDYGYGGMPYGAAYGGLPVGVPYGVPYGVPVGVPYGVPVGGSVYIPSYGYRR